MKFTLLLILILFTSFTYASNVPVNGQNLSPKTINFYVHLPDDYDMDRAEGYPVLFFFHGTGEKDTGGKANKADGTLDLNILSRVLSHGPPKHIQNDSWDTDLPFIVVTPQSKSKSGGFHTKSWLPVYNHIITSKNVNTSKVYVTGLSQGGNSTYNIYAGHADKVAAIIPIAAWYPQSLDCNAVKHVAVWAFHGDEDTVVGYPAGTGAINKVKACQPNHPAKYTVYANVAHDSWPRTYSESMADAYDRDDPQVDATANLGGDGIVYTKEIYKWLLSFSLGNDPLFPENNAPSVNAGVDQELILPDNSIVLSGSATDSDGVVESYLWAKVSGPSASLNGASTSQLSLSGLSEGTYIFSLTVTDNLGAAAVDEVILTVITPPSGSGSFVEISNSGYGRLYMQYFPGLENSDSSRVDVVGLGHNKITFHIKSISGSLDLDKLKIGMMAGHQSREVAISGYIMSLNEGWAKVEIPFSSFNYVPGKLEKGIYHVKFRAIGGAGTGSFGVDEIQFEGGTSPFVYYGDAYELSASTGYSFSGNGFIIQQLHATGGSSID